MKLFLKVLLKNRAHFLLEILSILLVLFAKFNLGLTSVRRNDVAQGAVCVVPYHPLRLAQIGKLIYPFQRLARGGISEETGKMAHQASLPPKFCGEN